MEIIAKEATIVEIYKNDALVEFGNKKQVVALASKKQVGDKVEVLKVKKFNTFVEILYSTLPLILFVLGFGFGFFFKENLYQYILASSCGILGFISMLFVNIFYVRKTKNYKYIAK